ncbi:MAG: aminopeptidase [Bacteroides sp.]|nr:aminopeptidase [Bacteroides sp.]
MKKSVRFSFFTTLALLLLCSLPLTAQESLSERLLALEGVAKVEELPTTAFPEKYLVYFTQPIDHNNPSKGTFRQRVVVGHAGFSKPTIIVTEGYGGAYALGSAYQEELSKLLDANLIFVEHRYFLESTPAYCDWTYLTAEASACDLHAIRTTLGALYQKKWIATGISKGGQTTLIYRTFFPNDVDISVPYVAPLCKAVEDGRHEPFLKKVGTREDRRKVKAFQLEVLQRKATLLPLFEAYCKEKNYRFRAEVEEIFDFSVLEYSFALWQWGTPTEEIPGTEATDEALFRHLITISEPGYFDPAGGFLPFFVQAAKELGYYGYDTKPFRKYLSVTTSKGYLHRLMLPEALENLQFDAALHQRISNYLRNNDPKIMFIYGENDPWTAAGVTWLKGKKEMRVFVQPGGSHKARIQTLPQAMKEEAIAILKQWLAE